MRKQLKGHFEMSFSDRVVVCGNMIGGCHASGSIVAVMGTRVFT